MYSNTITAAIVALLYCCILWFSIIDSGILFCAAICLYNCCMCSLLFSHYCICVALWPLATKKCTRKKCIQFNLRRNCALLHYFIQHHWFGKSLGVLLYAFANVAFCRSSCCMENGSVVIAWLHLSNILALWALATSTLCKVQLYLFSIVISFNENML